MTTTCPACGSKVTIDFHEQLGVPVNSCLLLDDPGEAAEFPTGDLVLAACEDCGFIFNRAFDPNLSEYSARYEETQGFSPRFQQFMRDLAETWVARHDLRGKHLLEIGCGKGEFLATIVALAGATGTGIDPSWRADRPELEIPRGVEFITDFYGEQYSHLTGDAVICRHTLEHIAEVRSFVDLVRRSIGGGEPANLWELPDTERVLRDVAFEDIYYEHCSYFTRGSLARLFRRCGFDPVALSLAYDDQYIVIDAVPGSGESPLLPGEDDLADTLHLVDHFAGAFPAKLKRWREDLGSWRSGRGRAVIWGAGSKGVAYLTTLKITGEIEYAVDINPYKQGKYMAGTGQQVVAPEFLTGYRPDVIIVMNSVYLDEIRATVDEIGVDADLISV